MRLPDRWMCLFPMGLCILAAGCAAREGASPMGLPAEPAATTESVSGSAAPAAPAAPADAPGPTAPAKPAKPEPPPPSGAARQYPAGPTTRYLSADDSNSTASAVVARKFIRAGRYVPPEIVRPYEFLNYAGFDYPPPQDAPVAVYAHMRPLKVPGRFSLQIAVRGPDRKRTAMLPMKATLLVDTSGSMAGEPIRLARQFARAFAERLRPGDSLSLVTFNRRATVVLDALPAGPDLSARVEEALRAVEPNDVTDLEGGVTKAYEIAGRGHAATHTSRVILISDGGANAGTLAREVIAKHAEDSERQGIYLTGVGVGVGLNDALMNAVTDRGRGAYVFLDSEAEIARLLRDDGFAATFDLAVKDVRLKLVLPPRFAVEAFHGEQISATASEVIPQYLSPNDQMIYHLEVGTDLPEAEARAAVFEFEAEFRPIPGDPARLALKRSVGEMLSSPRAIQKGDAVVAYAEALKQVLYPLAPNREANLKGIDAALAEIGALQEGLKDPEVGELLTSLRQYRDVADRGERWEFARDGQSEAPADALGISSNDLQGVEVRGLRPEVAVKTITQLHHSTRLRPLEGYRMLAIGSGPIGNPSPAGGGQLSSSSDRDPLPAFLGQLRSRPDGRPVFDKHQVVLKLTAPKSARSFSFDFNYFSAEYPNYVKKNYNDTFYAILEATSTNNAQPTNISFDANNNSIEVDNNYFQNPFHPIPNTGTGFDAHGSTGWLRTCWPIQGGERFTLTFSIHDEGDGVYDSVVVLDNFQWHEDPATGTTDPLN